MHTPRHRFIAFTFAAILSLASGVGSAGAAVSLVTQDIDWSTTNGVVSQYQAKNLNTGGRLLAYVY